MIKLLSTNGRTLLQRSDTTLRRNGDHFNIDLGFIRLKYNEHLYNKIKGFGDEVILYYTSGYIRLKVNLVIESVVEEDEIDIFIHCKIVD